MRLTCHCSLTKSEASQLCSPSKAYSVNVLPLAHLLLCFAPPILPSALQLRPLTLSILLLKQPYLFLNSGKIILNLQFGIYKTYILYYRYTENSELPFIVRDGSKAASGEVAKE